MEEFQRWRCATKHRDHWWAWRSNSMHLIWWMCSSVHWYRLSVGRQSVHFPSWHDQISQQKIYKSEERLLHHFQLRRCHQRGHGWWSHQRCYRCLWFHNYQRADSTWRGVMNWSVRNSSQVGWPWWNISEKRESQTSEMNSTFRQFWRRWYFHIGDTLGWDF